MRSDLDEFDPVAVVANLQAKQRSPEEVAAYEAEEQRRETARVAEVLQLLGVPRRVRDTLAKPAETRALALVREWAAQPESAWCVVLSASYGVGKSTAAGWWLSQACASVQPAPGLFRRWWPASEIAALDMYGEDYKRLCECQSLVIDDVGAEYADQKGAFASKFDRLIDARYREYRRTVITTNLDAKAFVERYDRRIFDRLRDGGKWLSWAGQSMRRSA
jgi:DNA replication protein DnaC